MVRNHVRLGRPVHQCQSAGRRLMAARRSRVLSSDGTARVMWPNRRSLLDITRICAAEMAVRYAALSTC